MFTLLRSLLAFLSAAVIAALASTSEAQSEQYWSAGGWVVYSATPNLAESGCAAFLTTQTPELLLAFGTDGLLALAISGGPVDGMSGKLATISVDGRDLHKAVVEHKGDNAILRGLTVETMRAIAGGKWLSIIGNFSPVRFNLAGAATAIGVMHRCVQELRLAFGLPAVPPQPSPPPAQRKAPAGPGVSTGTGFYVSESGHIFTNAHVVKGCVTIIASEEGGGIAKAYRKGSDPTHDPALLQIDRPPRAGSQILTWREDVQLGEEIGVYGFPYYGSIATTGTFTRGDVTALAGIKGNSAHLQFSAPVQPGNSGGPVANAGGRLSVSW